MENEQIPTTISILASRQPASLKLLTRTSEPSFIRSKFYTNVTRQVEKIFKFCIGVCNQIWPFQSMYQSQLLDLSVHFFWAIPCKLNQFTALYFSWVIQFEFTLEMELLGLLCNKIILQFFFSSNWKFTSIFYSLLFKLRCPNLAFPNLKKNANFNMINGQEFNLINIE